MIKKILGIVLLSLMVMSCSSKEPTLKPEGFYYQKGSNYVVDYFEIVSLGNDTYNVKDVSEEEDSKEIIHKNLNTYITNNKFVTYEFTENELKMSFTKGDSTFRFIKVEKNVIDDMLYQDYRRSNIKESEVKVEMSGTSGDNPYYLYDFGSSYERIEFNEQTYFALSQVNTYKDKQISFSLYHTLRDDYKDKLGFDEINSNGTVELIQNDFKYISVNEKWNGFGDSSDSGIIKQGSDDYETYYFKFTQGDFDLFKPFIIHFTNENDELYIEYTILQDTKKNDVIDTEILLLKK